MRNRGFEVAKGFEDKGINLPERKTKSNQSVKLVLALNTNTLILQLGDLIDLLVNYVMMLTACSY